MHSMRILVSGTLNSGKHICIDGDVKIMEHFCPKIALLVHTNYQSSLAAGG